MNNLYNVVQATYTRNFLALRPRVQFHFASRHYLWQRDSQAQTWLEQLRPAFTASGQPRRAIRQLLAEPLPVLRQTNSIRGPYFAKYPRLRYYDRVLFRLLFMQTVYGLETAGLFYEFFDKDEVYKLREALLRDEAALAGLSSFALNFLYLLDQFVNDSNALPLEQLHKVADSRYDASRPLERQLQCYFYTHCIIADSLFYARPVPLGRRTVYLQMLHEIEHIVEPHLANMKLDVLFEFLVCCRLLAYQSYLESQINRRAQLAISPQGFLVEPLNKRLATLSNAEHRNVLFLMGQRPYQPLTA